MLGCAVVAAAGGPAWTGSGPAGYAARIGSEAAGYAARIGSEAAEYAARIGSETAGDWLSRSDVSTDASDDRLIEGGQVEFRRFLSDVDPVFWKIPSCYNSVDVGRRPVVRSQGSDRTCWALAAASALESSLLPEERIVFSADHMVSCNAFSVPADEGGDYLMVMAYLSGWQGPVAETDSWKDESSLEDCEDENAQNSGENENASNSCEDENVLNSREDENALGSRKDEDVSEGRKDECFQDSRQPAVHVQEMQLLGEASREEIKAAILDCGAVQTSLYMNRKETAPTKTRYHAFTSAYYCSEERVQDHDIIILGWDDSYSRFLFREVPDEDGAWICQNTWGDAFGEGGIFYVSYADANIGRTAIAYTRVEPADNYDAIYQTDDCGWQGSQGYGDEDCWIANQYRAKEEESLAAVGLYATGRDTVCDLYLVRESAPDERIFLQSASFDRPGYYTVDLEQPMALAAGEAFLVIAKFHTPGSTHPAAVEYSSDDYTQNVTLEGKRGYISHDGENWTCTETVYGSNVCLKAYVKKIKM